MIDVSIPYFLTNEDWYYYDDDKEMYFLTKDAPKEAVDSYNEFYEDDID